MKKGIVIACDIDEVLFPYLAGYVKYYNRIHGTHVKMSDFHSYNFCLVHGGTQEYISDIVYGYQDQPEFSQVEPITGALEAVQKLQTMGELHFVTARQERMAPQTRDWIAKHFGIDGHRIHFGNHFAKPTDAVTAIRSKIEMCKAIGADILIDDSASYATECAEAGMKVFLFDMEGEYNWNKSVKEHLNIVRVHGWAETLGLIDQFASERNKVDQ